MKDVILTLDIGTSSVRCSAHTLYRQHGPPHHDGVAVCDNSKEEVSLVEGTMVQLKWTILDDKGKANLSLIETTVEQCINHCLAALEVKLESYRVVAMGLDSFVMNFFGVDMEYASRDSSFMEEGHDKESKNILYNILERLGRLEAIVQETGVPIHQSYASVQLAAFRQRDPETFATVKHWKTLSSHLMGLWIGHKAGRVPVSYCEASWTGLLNFRLKCWHKELLEILGIEADMLPPLANFDGCLQGLSDHYSKRWPVLRLCSFFLGVGDGAAANIGSKCTVDSRVALTIGTSAAMRVVISDATFEARGGLVPAGLWCYRLDEDHLLIGGALTDGGSVYEWCNSALGAEIPEGTQTMDSSCAAEAPDSHGLTILPFLSGERAPGWRDHARAAIIGITKNTTSEQILRASMEAVALRLATILTLLEPVLPDSFTVIGSGAALLNSKAWQHIIADALGRPLILEPFQESTLKGVAYLIAGSLKSTCVPGRTALQIRELDHKSTRVEPDHAFTQIYARARRRQEELYGLLYHTCTH